MSLDKIKSGLQEPIKQEESTFDREGIGFSIHKLNRPYVRTYNNTFQRFNVKPMEESKEEPNKTIPAK